MHEDSGVGTFTKFSLESCSGEARVNNRKGKIILFFEWNITLSYVTGNLISAHLRCIKMLSSQGVSGKRGSEVQGRIELHNFTEDLDELEDASRHNLKMWLILKFKTEEMRDRILSRFTDSQ